jgi:hypothetical protein
MSKQRRLTVRGVKSILSRAGVDYSALEVTERGDSVEIAGTRDERRASADVLYGRGLWCAPFPDRDCWTLR